MPFDSHLAAQFHHIEQFSSFEAALATPEGAAQYAKWMEDPAPWSLPEGLSITDRSIDGPHGTIPVRIYRPEAPLDVARPALLWLHGGAFLFGGLDMNESHVVSAELASRAGAVVVSVDYRLAGDGVQYPVPLDDVVAAWNWLIASADELGTDPARSSIGGASAGGNLATAASMRVRDEGGPLPRQMLLAYPLVHFPIPALDPAVVVEMQALPAMLHFGGGFHEFILHSYIGRITDIPAGYAPGNFALEGMPPAVIAPAEYDELRPSAELFARQLRSVGVPVAVELAEGMVHGHLDRTPGHPAVDRTLRFFATALA
ncbi:alpha/beta hydrolase [Galbitalea soli]|uniref:Alpha/beta hydrolase n=1 Tax=Galbitalea soli TaxID=1268042 RepID=A0A7C9PPN3_9MICO|nr:alpha/beta hydrolase [Galbitalea soli]NEM92269.1 alpha/beta hydrolase [Galbitalea soli]NYJ31775.1 acetyl esterase/lipase [Galbitalea soli]